jgi:hypothetical protein
MQKPSCARYAYLYHRLLELTPKRSPHPDPLIEVCALIDDACLLGYLYQAAYDNQSAPIHLLAA